MSSAGFDTTLAPGSLSSDFARTSVTCGTQCRGGRGAFCPVGRDPQGPLSPTQGPERGAHPGGKDRSKAPSRFESQRVPLTGAGGSRPDTRDRPSPDLGGQALVGCAQKACVRTLGTRVAWTLTGLPPAAGPRAPSLSSRRREGITAEPTPNRKRACGSPGQRPAQGSPVRRAIGQLLSVPVG